MIDKTGQRQGGSACGLAGLAFGAGFPVVVRLRRGVGCRNRPFAALTPGGQRSFPEFAGFARWETSCPPGSAGVRNRFRRGAYGPTTGKASAIPAGHWPTEGRQLMSSDTTSPIAATSVRNVTLADLAAMLRDQPARKVDIVAPASAIRAACGQLVIDGTDPVLGSDGVTMTTGAYVPTEVCDQGLADKLGIPTPYLRRMRERRPDLYDANVNGWLDGDPRRFLIRCLRPGSGTGSGAARAFLSDGYKRIDNLDVLLAALDGVRAAGVPVEVDGCDLTERRMYVRGVCEQVATLAPALLAGYRSPFTGAAGADNPVVFAGFVISNSETGCGALTLTPRLVVQVCRNGMTITVIIFSSN